MLHTGWYRACYATPLSSLSKIVQRHWTQMMIYLEELVKAGSVYSVESVSKMYLVLPIYLLAIYGTLCFSCHIMFLIIEKYIYTLSCYYHHIASITISYGRVIPVIVCLMWLWHHMLSAAWYRFWECRFRCYCTVYDVIHYGPKIFLFVCWGGPCTLHPPIESNEMYWMKISSNRKYVL